MIDIDNRRLKVVGMKQVLRALETDQLECVYIAMDADHKIRSAVDEAARERSVQRVYVSAMKELGSACGIQVGAATAGILRPGAEL